MMIFDFLIPGEVGHVHATCGLINDTLGPKLQLWLLCKNDKVYGVKNTAVPTWIFSIGWGGEMNAQTVGNKVDAIQFIQNV